MKTKKEKKTKTKGTNDKEVIRGASCNKKVDLEEPNLTQKKFHRYYNISIFTTIMYKLEILYL